MSTGRFAHDARNASLGRGRGLIALCAVAASVLLAACGSDSSSTTGPGGTTQKTPDGSYSISTINNGPLPAAIFSDTGGFKLEVMSGTITLTTAGQYSIVTNFRETLPGVLDTYSDSTGGTWVMPAGSTTIQFTDGSDGSKDQATWTNGQLTFIEPGVPPAQITFVYKLTK
ncbi:MAG TPA: hypothetical protein VEU08_09560 [Vicinamibacterales bacterium]|nr:hypothetical protein [Vicinamibacterales bacterium]